VTGPLLAGILIGAGCVFIIGLLRPILFPRWAGKGKILDSRVDGGAGVLLEAVPDMFFVFDANGTLLDFKPAPGISPLLPPEEFLGKNIKDVLPPDVSGNVLEYIGRTLATGVPQYFQYELHVDGLPCQYEARMVLFGDGEVLAIVRDVTELAEAQRKLAELQEIDEKILDGSPLAFVLHDPDMHTVRVSSAYQAVTGFDPEEVLGRTPEEFMPDGPNKREIIERITRVREEGRRFGPHDIVSPLPGRYLRETILPLFDDNGKVSHTLSVLEDITDRKRMETALKDSEIKYRVLFNKANDGLLVYESLEDGRPGRILEVNHKMSAMLGYTREELLKMTPRDFIKPESETDGVEVEKRFQTEGSAVFERVLVSKSGAEIPVEVNSHLFEFSGSMAVLGILRDITDRKLAEDRIRDSLAEKDVLLKEIHHRVKNNLQVISGLLNLQSHYIGDEKVKGIFKESQNRVKTMALIHEELYQARDLASVDFSDYIRSLVKNLFASYSIDPDALSLELDLEDVNMVVDTAIPCGLILNELVSNSLKHAFPDGRRGKMKVRFVSNGEKSYTLSVADDGAGFPKDLDITRTKSLGMQLVNILVEQLGGTMELDRRGGTRFTVSFKEYREAGINLT